MKATYYAHILIRFDGLCYPLGVHHMRMHTIYRECYVCYQPGMLTGFILEKRFQCVLLVWFEAEQRGHILASTQSTTLALQSLLVVCCLCKHKKEERGNVVVISDSLLVNMFAGYSITNVSGCYVQYGFTV